MLCSEAEWAVNWVNGGMEGDPEVGPGASAELGDLPSSALILHVLHVCSWKRYTRLVGGVAMCKTVQTVLAHGSARLAKGQQICHWLITSFLEDHDEYILTIRWEMVLAIAYFVWSILPTPHTPHQKSNFFFNNLKIRSFWHQLFIALFWDISIRIFSPVIWLILSPAVSFTLSTSCC